MKKKTQNPVSLAKIYDIDFMERGGEIWLTSGEIARKLGYATHREVNHLFRRNKSELQPHSTVVGMTTCNGNRREARVFNEEGVYLITMLARTPKAREFRAQVARLVKDIRQQHIDAARSKAALEARISMANDLLSVAPARLKLIQKAVAYRRKGLLYREVGKLLDVGKDTARQAVNQGRALGLMDMDGEVAND